MSQPKPNPPGQHILNDNNILSLLKYGKQAVGVDLPQTLDALLGLRWTRYKEQTGKLALEMSRNRTVSKL
jgi:hypothetical protein